MDNIHELVRRLLGLDDANVERAQRTASKARSVLDSVRAVCESNEEFGDALVDFDQCGWRGAVLLREFEQRKKALASVDDSKETREAWRMACTLLGSETAAAHFVDGSGASKAFRAAQRLIESARQTREAVFASAQLADARAVLRPVVALHSVRRRAAESEQAFQVLFAELRQGIKQWLLLPIDADDDIAHAAYVCAWLLVRRIDVFRLVGRQAPALHEGREPCSCRWEPPRSVLLPLDGKPSAHEPDVCGDDANTLAACVHAIVCSGSIERAYWATACDLDKTMLRRTVDGVEQVKRSASPTL